MQSSNEASEIEEEEGKEETKKEDPRSGQMIEDENLEETRVSSKVYSEFLKYLGGWKFVVFSQLAMVMFTIFKILNDY